MGMYNDLILLTKAFQPQHFIAKDGAYYNDKYHIYVGVPQAFTLGPLLLYLRISTYSNRLILGAKVKIIYEG